MSFTAGIVAIMFVLESIGTMACCFGWLHESEKHDTTKIRNIELRRENAALYKEIEKLYKEIVRQGAEIIDLKFNTEEKKDV